MKIMPANIGISSLGYKFIHSMPVISNVPRNLQHTLKLDIAYWNRKSIITFHLKIWIKLSCQSQKECGFSRTWRTQKQCHPDKWYVEVWETDIGKWMRYELNLQILSVLYSHLQGFTIPLTSSVYLHNLALVEFFLPVYVYEEKSFKYNYAWLPA